MIFVKQNYVKSVVKILTFANAWKLNIKAEVKGQLN